MRAKPYQMARLTPAQGMRAIVAGENAASRTKPP